jgi:putative sugar O-methyltransferase
MGVLLDELKKIMTQNNTSISDNITYPEICLNAATQDQYFDTFKSISGYTDILEHVSYEEGLEYIRNITNRVIIDNIEKFKINDTIGSPRSYNYNFGIFSPTTLRYAKVLNDLSQLNLNDKTIIEIGAGYGGQYTVLRQLYKPKKYIFIDLPPVLQLIKKYITTLNLNDIDIEYYSADDIPEQHTDLVISNYAFSECPIDIQDIYINKILEHAKNGYMIYNNMLGYTHNELLEKVSKKIKINKEIPQTHPKNVLLTW